MATPSICSYSCPLNWNSWSLVDALRRSTEDTRRFLSLESLGKFKPVRDHIDFEFLNKTPGCDPLN